MGYRLRLGTCADENRTAGSLSAEDMSALVRYSFSILRPSWHIPFQAAAVHPDRRELVVDLAIARRSFDTAFAAIRAAPWKIQRLRELAPPGSLRWRGIRGLCLFFDVRDYVEMLAILARDYAEHRYLVLGYRTDEEGLEILQRAERYGNYLSALESEDFKAFSDSPELKSCDDWTGPVAWALALLDPEDNGPAIDYFAATELGDDIEHLRIRGN